MPDTAIEVSHVSKKFAKDLVHLMRYGFSDIAKSVLGLNTHSEKLRPEEFWAVNNVSFKLKKGEALGIIGPNGSGKTTILKMLNGILAPDKGKIKVKGKVGALIEVGAGFHPMLTGRENIYINGAILGMKKKEIDEKFDQIVEFADIGEFLDAPVKTYSSGMFVRLGFAIAAHSNPDILLVDEILAVGDMAFQTKCFKKIHQFVKEQKTIVFISHTMPAIQGICKRTLWLDKGKIKLDGKTRETIARYCHQMNTQPSFSPAVSRSGSGEIKIVEVKVMDKNNQPTDVVKAGEALKIRIAYQAVEPVHEVHFHFGLRDIATGIMVTFIDVNWQNSPIPKVIKGAGQIDCIFNPLPLRPRRYGLYLRIGYPTQAFDIWDDRNGRFTVSGVSLGLDSGFLHGRDDLVGIPFKIKHRVKSLLRGGRMPSSEVG